MDHSLTLAIALIWGISVFLWAGDLQGAEEHIDRLIARADSHSLLPYLAVGRGFKAELAIRRGDASGGVAALRACLEKLHPMPYELLSTYLNISLVQGYAALGQFAESITLIDDTIQRVETNGDVSYMPELLRLKGKLVQSIPGSGADAPETYFMQSLELSRRQGARGWELRTAVDLAGLWAAQGQSDGAFGLLQPVFRQFTDGLDTPDLKAAGRLLATLS